MESLLDEIAERGLVDKRYHRLLDAVKPDGPGQSPPLTLPELLAAKNEGRLGGANRTDPGPAFGPSYC